jgi:hypothetical protein
LIKEGLVEVKEVLEKTEAKFKRWHFEQIENYFSILDVAINK